MNRWEAKPHKYSNGTRYVITDVHPTGFGGKGLVYDNWVVFAPLQEESDPADIDFVIPGYDWEHVKLDFGDQVSRPVKAFGRVIVDCHNDVPLDVFWVQRPVQP